MALKGLRKFFKILAYVLITVCALLLLLYFILQIPSARRYLGEKLQEIISHKTQTRVEIGEIGIKFPFDITATNVFFEDLKHDTLISLEKLSLNISIARLISKELLIEEIMMEEGAVNIYRAINDSSFNYSFLLDVFPSKKSKTGKESNFSAANIYVKSINFKYKDAIEGIDLYTKLGILQAKALSIKGEEILLSGFDLNNSLVAYTQGESQESSSSKSNVKITADDIVLKNNTIKYNVSNSEKRKGLDFKHFSALNLSGNIKYFKVLGKDIYGDANSLSFKESSGLFVKRLTANFKYVDERTLEFKNLDLQTQNSRIKNYVRLTLADSVADIGIDADLKNSRFVFSDVAYFQPDILEQPQINLNKNKTIQIHGKASGKVNDLTLNNLQLAMLSGTRLNVSGNIKGLPETKNAVYDLAFKDSETRKSDIKQLIGKDALPGNISLPNRINFSGKFSGHSKNFQTDLNAITSQGNVTGDILVATDHNNSKTYSGNIFLDEFNLGGFLNQASLGNATLSAQFKGKGTSMNDLSTELIARAEKFEINNYAYHNISADLKYDNALISGKADINDKNLQLTIEGSARVQKENSLYDFTFNVHNSNLKNLNLSKDTIEFKGLAKVNIKGKDSTYFGYISIINSLLTKNSKTYKSDSLLYFSFNEKSLSYTEALRWAVAGNFWGNIHLGSLPGALANQINRYFNIEKLIPAKPTDKLQNFAFKLYVNRPEVIFALLNVDAEAGQFQAAGSFKSLQSNLTFNAYLPYINYKENKLDSLSIAVSSDDKNLNYAAKLRRFSSKKLNIHRPEITGKAHDNLNEIYFSTTGNDTDRFLIGGILKPFQNGYKFSVDPNNFLIDSKAWNISEDNYVVFSGKNFYVNNLKIEKEGHSLTLNSRKQSYSSPLDIKFRDFDIGLFSRILNPDTLMVEGNTTGYLTLENLQSTPGFISDLKINSLIYKGDSLGNLTLKASKTSNESYKMDLILAGNGNDLKAKGFYTPSNKENSLGLDVDISKLNLSTIEVLAQGHISDLSGSITSKLKVTGTLNSPKTEGFIHFKDTEFKMRYVNTLYKIPDEKVEISNGRIEINSMEMLDSIGNKALISGYITVNDSRNVSLDLDIITDDFLALNSLRRPNSFFYGSAYIDSRMHIGGTVRAPVFDINAKFNKGSTLTIILPKDIKAPSHNGIVDFGKIIEQNISSGDSSSAELKNITLTANIEVDENTQIKLIVDEYAGDSLMVKGKTTFSYSIDPGNKYSLTGVYEIYEGVYYATLNNYIKRKFIIQKGSNLKWTGDPFGAETDIHSIYKVRTSAYPLMEPQLLSSSANEKNRFKQRLPFEVHLYMKNKLIRPDISFEILLPIEQQGAFGGAVFARLNQLNQVESEVNQQVFALVILNRFINQKPFGSPSDELTNAATTTVSKFFSQQLNYLSATYFKAVEFSFDLNSYHDYSTGDANRQTELNVIASKTFNDDRIKVQAEGVIDLQKNQEDNAPVETSTTSRTTSPSSPAEEILEPVKNNNTVTDLSVEYDLTRDGIYKLRGLRRTGYVGVFDGEVSETRLSLIFNRDYNRFKDLFTRPRTEKRTTKGR